MGVKLVCSLSMMWSTMDYILMAPVVAMTIAIYDMINRNP